MWTETGTQIGTDAGMRLSCCPASRGQSCRSAPRLRNMPTPDGVSSALPSRLPEPIDSPIIQNDGKTMSPLRPEWMHLARHEPIGSSVIHE